MKPKPPLGYYLEADSQIDGNPIVLLFVLKSTNSKTGPMIQVHILPKDLDPASAIRAGADAAICGECPLRHYYRAGLDKAERDSRPWCYVAPGRGSSAAWRAYKTGRYVPLPESACGRFFSGLPLRPIRWGAYGDPFAIPAPLWRKLFESFHSGTIARKWTAYTHQWRRPAAQYLRETCMASVDSVAQAAEAETFNWRWFLYAKEDVDIPAGSFECPASPREDHRLTCSRCRACNGNRRAQSAGNVIIREHGFLTRTASAV